MHGHWATKLTTKSNHVKDLAAKWIKLATKLNEEAALHLLSSDDVTSNELFYHDEYFGTIWYQYNKFTKSKSDKS